MNNDSVPLLAYAFISITTLVMAYATFLDTGDNQTSESATSLLPSIQSLNPFNSASPVANAVPVTPQKVSTFGGKSRRHKNKHHSTKRHKK